MEFRNYFAGIPNLFKRLKDWEFGGHITEPKFAFIEFGFSDVSPEFHDSAAGSKRHLGIRNARDLFQRIFDTRYAGGTMNGRNFECDARHK